MLAVESIDLRKTFTTYASLRERFRNRKTEVEALRGINLEIKEGELFGLLGPNGAGKTTFISILSTLLLPTSGTARIFGLDVVENADEVRKIINLCPAYSGFFGEQTVRENLDIYARMFNSTTEIDSIINMLSLSKYADTRFGFGELSSGNRQKVVVAKSLLSNAKLLLMDELTVGLDPDVAIKIRKLIRNWNRKNRTTIILTTHNMYEADKICDRVAIIYDGRIVACDIPKKLKKTVNEEECIEISIVESIDPTNHLKKIEGVKRVVFKDFSMSIHVDDAEKRLQKIIELLLSKHYHIKTVNIREPTLEDVFIKMTGVRLE